MHIIDAKCVRALPHVELSAATAGPTDACAPDCPATPLVHLLVSTLTGVGSDCYKNCMNFSVLTDFFEIMCRHPTALSSHLF